MTMEVLMLTGDNGHVGGQVGIGQGIIEVPSFEVAVGLCQKEREQLLLDKALEISPDLSLTRASSLFWQPVTSKEIASHE